MLRSEIIMERQPGPSSSATPHPAGWPVDNGRPSAMNTIRRLPQSNPPRHAASSSTAASITTSQVVSLAEEAMKDALEENQSKAADVSEVSSELKPGVTIDLSHKQIQRFPEEVVDIIKNELERLALSHNQISTFPARFAECTSLRYLNVRSNIIREFPSAICLLTALEILDLGRNKLRSLPPSLAQLSSLKVLSIEHNRIDTLPDCLADMSSLQVLKFKGNPIKYPPKEILQTQATSPPNGAGQEHEIDDLAATTQIKKFMKQKKTAVADRSETESGGEESSEGPETPRPMKRVISGRFPIKVNGNELPDVRSPALPRPPPIPSRSHYRGLSQQNAALRRPGVLPLTIGSTNERLRSNSENILQATRTSTDRSRRTGILWKKPSDLGTVDESKVNRYSHYRGLSHGSALSGPSNVPETNTGSPASPADSGTIRATYVRRLSSLPERKRESHAPDIVIEGAKGILFALFQVHHQIQNLLGITRDGTNKRTSLERVFYNATTHVEELDRELQSYITYSEEDEEIAPRSNENVHRACLTAVSAYVHVCALLSRNLDILLSNGDPRYIRALLLLIYGSLAEVRNAGGDLFPAQQTRASTITTISESSEETIRHQQRTDSITPTRERPGTSLRQRSGTVLQQPGNLRVMTDAAPPPFLNSASRLMSLTTATPRSGESFASSNISGIRLNGGEIANEDTLFENIFLNLQKTSEIALQSLPVINSHFITAMRANDSETKPDQPPLFWQILIQKTSIALQTTEALKGRLSSLKFKEPGVRTQSAFWELCNTFIENYTMLVVKVKEAKARTALFPGEVIALLRPLQKAIKTCGQLIQTSPWAYLATSQPSTGSSSGSSFSTKAPPTQVSLPMTPQSAVLGPAAQATVPSQPYNPMFSKDVFERADAFLSMNGHSAASSRAGTMTSNDGTITPGSVLSPMNSATARFVGNGNNGKTAF